MAKKSVEIIKPPMEILYKEELEALKQNDNHPKPSFFNISPKMVKVFILGSEVRDINIKLVKKRKR